MSHAPAAPAPAGTHPKITELERKGFRVKSETTTIFRGREVTRTKLEKNKTSGVVERIARGAAGIVTFPLLLSQDHRDRTINPAISGSAKETVYTPTGREFEDAAEIENLGFDPKNGASIQAHLEKPEIRAQIRESNGHYFLPVRQGKWSSRFLFVPNGDFSKAKSIKMWTAKDGKAITNTEQMLRAARSYCASYSEIEKGVEDLQKDLAKHVVRLGRDRGVTEDEAKEAIKRRPKTVVIDMRYGQLRFYGKLDPNRVNPDSAFTGTVKGLKDQTKKEINRIHGKMESKEPLEGERPFKKALKPTPDVEDI